MGEPYVWRGHTELHWRNDCYGNTLQALYAGGLWVGSLMWSPIGDTKPNPWRAWLSTDDDGSAVGWYVTEQEARDALVDAAVRALTQPTE